MKAIVLHQPWAQFVALGWKRLETRSWATKYRGPLAICAAKTLLHWGEAPHLARRAGFDPSAHPVSWSFGAIVAVANVTGCFKVVRHGPAAGSSREIVTADGRAILVREADMILGDLSPGRVGWHLEGVRALVTPVPVRGCQCLWDLDEATERKVLAQLEAAPVVAAGGTRS